MIQDLLQWSFLFSVFRMATPLLGAALGGLLSERSGVVNIALEGQLLVGAFAGASVAFAANSAWMGWWAAGCAGILWAFIFAFFVVKLKGEPIVVGTALNLLAMGMIPLLSKMFFQTTGSTPALGPELRMTIAPLVILFLAVGCIYFWLKFISSGLWVSLAGRKPEALMAQGISLDKVQISAVCAGGLLTGWGGASLSLFLSSSYSPLMSGGRGFIALAAMILGRWQPFSVLAACLLFGFMEALQIRMQGVSVGDWKIPVQFIQMLPYVVTLLVLFQSYRKTDRKRWQV